MIASHFRQTSFIPCSSTTVQNEARSPRFLFLEPAAIERCFPSCCERKRRKNQTIEQQNYKNEIMFCASPHTRQQLSLLEAGSVRLVGHTSFRQVAGKGVGETVRQSRLPMMCTANGIHVNSHTRKCTCSWWFGRFPPGFGVHPWRLRAPQLSLASP